MAACKDATREGAAHQHYLCLSETWHSLQQSATVVQRPDLITVHIRADPRTACLHLLSWCRGVEGASLSELELYKDWAKRHMSAMIARLQKSERERREETQRVRAAASQLIKVLQLLMASVCCWGGFRVEGLGIRV